MRFQVEHVITASGQHKWPFPVEKGLVILTGGAGGDGGYGVNNEPTEGGEGGSPTRVNIGGQIFFANGGNGGDGGVVGPGTRGYSGDTTVVSVNEMHQGVVLDVEIGRGGHAGSGGLPRVDGADGAVRLVAIP